MIYVGLTIDEEQCDPGFNLQHLLEQEMFFICNISKHHNAECAAVAHLKWAHEGQSQVQMQTYILYICIKKPSIFSGWQQHVENFTTHVYNLRK